MERFGVGVDPNEAFLVFGFRVKLLESPSYAASGEAKTRGVQTSLKHDSIGGDISIGFVGDQGSGNRRKLIRSLRDD